MAIALPLIVSQYLAASDLGPVDAVVAGFTEDAVIFDEDEEWHGHPGVRQWREDVTTIYEYTVRCVARSLSARSMASNATTCTPTSRGKFPGGLVDLTNRFGLRDGRIAGLEIVPAEADES